MPQQGRDLPAIVGAEGAAAREALGHVQRANGPHAGGLPKGLRATPGAENRVEQTFAELLWELEEPGVTRGEAEGRVTVRRATALTHAVTVR